MIPMRSHAVLKLVGLFTSGRCGLCHSFIVVMPSDPHSLESLCYPHHCKGSATRTIVS